MTRIVVTKFGRIEDSDIDFVKDIMEDCYLRLEPHEVSYVDLHLFEHINQMRAFFTRERLELGVLAKGFEDVFAAQHDAWRGISRISLSFDSLGSLPREIQVGSIRHEVGHSVLHGGIEYYVISPSLLSTLAVESDSSEEFARSFLYLISIGVKDFEVTRLLAKRGYVEDQLAYAINAIGTTDDDTLAWCMSGSDLAAKVLCTVSRFKEICCAAPFLHHESFGDVLREKIVGNMSYLGIETVRNLLRIARDELPALGLDTMKNIELLSRSVLRTLLRRS